MFKETPFNSCNKIFPQFYLHILLKSKSPECSLKIKQPPCTSYKLIFHTLWYQLDLCSLITDRVVTVILHKP